MAKPTSYLGWDPAEGPTTVVEPSSIKKLLGWLSGERPPAQFFNWFWKRTSSWIDYLGKETLKIGEFLLVDGNAIVPRLVTYFALHTEAVRTLQWEMARDVEIFGSSVPRPRVYVHNPDGTASAAELTVNARWTGTAWAKDRSGQAALMIRYQGGTNAPGRFVIAFKPAADNANWTDEYGEDAPVGWSGGVANLFGDGSISTLWGSYVITAGLAVLGDLILTGELKPSGSAIQVTGDVIQTGHFYPDAVTVANSLSAPGLNRSEHRGYLADYLGGGGTTSLHFADPALNSNVKDRIYRVAAGTVRAIYVWLDHSTSADVTIEVVKNGSTVLGAVTIEAGDTTGFFLPVTGNGYSAGDYLGLRISTAGDAAILTLDIGALFSAVQ